MSHYVLGSRSMNELRGVHPDLVAVVKRAITITEQDFAVHDGLREPEEQKALADRGASQTIRSRHLPEFDQKLAAPYGHAVDLVPVIGGKLRWEWGPIYKVAEAVRQAAFELQTPVRWGGAWDADFTLTTMSPEKLVQAYAARHQGPDFLDGPHFELPRNRYP